MHFDIKLKKNSKKKKKKKKKKKVLGPVKGFFCGKVVFFRNS